MRSILFLFLLISLNSLAFCQVTEKEDHRDDEHLSKFEGKWKATRGQGTLIILLEERIIHPPRLNYSKDVMLGWYKFIHRGEVVLDSLNSAGGSWKTAFLIGNTDREDLNSLFIIWRDHNRVDRSIHATFQLSNTDQGILQMELGGGGLVYRENPPSRTGRKVPVPSTWKMVRIDAHECPPDNARAKSMVENFITNPDLSEERQETGTDSLTESQIEVVTSSSTCQTFESEFADRRPKYEVTYYKAGNFYFVVHLLKQPEEEDVFVAGLSIIMIFDSNLEYVNGYSG